MGRRRKWRERPRGPHAQADRDQRDERGWRPEPVLSNAHLEKYYKGQDIVPEGEWDQFYSKLKETLPVTFRITAYKGQAQELLNIIKGKYFDKFVDVEVDGQKVEPPKCLEWYPHGLAWQLDLTKKAIRGCEPLKQLHEFMVSETESGNISRQEAVSMIPPILLDVKSHHKVLDLCAAPGSKTAQIIEYLHSDEASPLPEGFVVANDNDNKRCYLMTHQVKRLQSPNCTIINHDATILPNLFLTPPNVGSPSAVKYDRVLADVPCSGDGTLRKNPDVWRKWNPAMGMNLHGLQLRVLKRGLELLAVGGRLVYSTCSLNPVEDEAVVSTMLQRSEGAIEVVEAESMLPGLRCCRGLSSWRCMSRKGEWFEKVEDVPPHLQNQMRPTMFPPEEKYAEQLNKCLRILPHHQDTGGFFIAVIHKTKPLPWTSTHRFSANQGSKECEESSVNSSEEKKSSKESENHNTEVESVDNQELKEDIENKDTKTDEMMEMEVTSASGDNLVGDSECDAEKRKVDRLEESPVPKKRKMGMFKEDPFLFLKGTEDFWPPIKSFFGVSHDFPEKQMMYRCADGKKRNVYFVSEQIRLIAENNGDRVKFINMGVKIFGRSPSPLVPQCDFRLAQEGLAVMRHYSSNRRLQLSRADLVTLLSEENPYLEKMSESVQSQAKELAPGSTVFLYTPADSDSHPACEIVVCGWKGKTSLRSFVAKFERAHYLRLCGLELSEIQKRVAEKKAEKAAADLSTEATSEDDKEGYLEEEEKDPGEMEKNAEDDDTALSDVVSDPQPTEAEVLENT